VFRDAIVTKEKMCGWGFVGNSLCLFFHSRQESSAHLYFKCSFSRRIWKAIMAKCLVDDPQDDWDLVVQWSIEIMPGKSLKSSIYRLYLGAVVYRLWLQRNALLHGKTPKTEEVILAQVKWEVRMRLLAKFSSNSNVKNLVLARRWNLLS
jgi:hypothetical protein